MNKEFNILYHSLKLSNGTTLPNRFVLSPMSIEGADHNGAPTQEDIDFWTRRADSASLLITGETSVGFHGCSTWNQLAITEENLPAFKKMATAMKSKGNKAILQIFHGGAKSKREYEENGIAYGPSNLDKSIMGYPVTALNSKQINTIIDDFGHATDLAIKAGFDGVEVSANFYLIYNFFSRFFNKRHDKWGGQTIMSRSAFALDALDSVKKTVASKNAKDFIIGFRIRPEDFVATGTESVSRTGNINHTLDDSLFLVSQVLEKGVDYIHALQWGKEAYKSKSATQEQSVVNNSAIYSFINGRVPYIVNGGIDDANKAVDSLNYGDMFSFATLALVDPDFKEKIAHDQQINYSFKDDLSLPENLKNQWQSVVVANPSIAEKNPNVVLDANSGASQA